MRRGTVTLLSAAVLLAPGCERRAEAERETDAESPLRRATFRSLAARDFLASCPGGAARAESLRQAARFEELKQLALRKEAGRALWLGENDWAAVSPHDEREPCEAGEEAYGQALAAYGETLDVLARRIAEYRQ